MGVEMLGFQVIPGVDNYISPEKYQDIRGWVAGPKIIAEVYGLSDPAQLDDLMQRYAPDYMEMTWTEYGAFSQYISLPCIVYHPQVGQIAASVPHDRIHYWITGEDSTCADDIERTIPVFKRVSSLQGIAQTLTEDCFSGIVLEGPSELRPGITSEQLGDLLEALDD